MIKRTLWVLALGLLAVGCGGDDTDPTPATAGVVEELKLPADNATVELEKTPSLEFSWYAAHNVYNPKYKLVFDTPSGNFAQPLYEVAAANNGLSSSVKLDFEQLDAIAAAAKADYGESATLSWAVVTANGDRSAISLEKRTITLVRAAQVTEAAVVETLTSPEDGLTIDLATADKLAFSWKAPEHVMKLGYKVLFDLKEGDFSKPLISFASAENGTDANVELTSAQLDQVAAAAKAGSGATAEVCWAVETATGSAKTVSTAKRTLNITRKTVFIAGSELRMAGAGTEEGQTLKYLGNNAYEIYTRLESGKAYEFKTADEGAVWRFYLSGTKVTELDASANAPTWSKATGTYRIKLDFGAKTATVQRIEKIVLRHCNKPAWDVALTYDAKGVWRANHYNVRISKINKNIEKRYKFIFTVDGAEEHWGKGSSTSNAPEVGKSSELSIVSSGQWDGVFNVPSQLIDNTNLFRWYADVEVSMAAGAAYSHTYANPEDITPKYPQSAQDWVPAADSCTFILVDQFLNKNKGVFKSQAHHITGQNNGGLYWQQAYPMHTVLFSYERIKNSNPTLAAQYLDYFKKFVQNRGNNYANTSNKPSPFWNNYTDDMAWHALLLLHMSEVLNDSQYADKAKTLYDKCMLETSRIREDADGWGLIWTLDPGKLDNSKDQRNACTNTPAMIIACKLHTIYKDQKYLDDAVKLFNLMANKAVQDNGDVSKNPNILTYTQGTWIEGCRLLYHITGDSKYMDRASKCALRTTQPECDCVNAAFGILRGEGTSNDQANFKGGLIPYMVNYANDEAMPADTRQTVKEFLNYNARVMWIHGMDKSGYPQSYVNFSWEAPYIVEGNPGSLGATSSGAALLEGVTRLK